MNHKKLEKPQKNQTATEHTENTEMGKTIPSGGEVLIYKTDNGQVKVDVRLVNETLWMTQTDMARLFQCSPDNISLHLKNIYDEGELSREATAEEFSVVRKEGSRTIRWKEEREATIKEILCFLCLSWLKIFSLYPVVKNHLFLSVSICGSKGGAL